MHAEVWGACDKSVHPYPDYFLRPKEAYLICVPMVATQGEKEGSRLPKDGVSNWGDARRG